MPAPDLLLNGRLSSDGGPIYAETNLDSVIVEPWAAASGLIFLVMAGYWLWRLRGTYRHHNVLTAAVPLILVGGLGCILYHATRSHRAFLLMDALPFPVLCMMAALWMWERVWRRWYIVMGGLLVVFAGLSLAADEIGLAVQTQINVAYAMFSLMILLPAVIVQVRTRGYQLPFVIGSAMFAALAVSSRSLDTMRPLLLPMGTHWLCHVFGAISGHLLITYMYRLGERDRLALLEADEPPQRLATAPALETEPEPA